MSLEIATECAVCSRVSTTSARDTQASWAALAGWRDCVVWPSPPAIGRTQEVWASYPFHARAGEPLWLLTGDDAPALVRCELRDLIGPYSGEWPPGHAWQPEHRVLVYIEEALPLTALVERHRPSVEPALDAYVEDLLEDDHADVRAHELGAVTAFDLSVEGDVGVYLYVVTHASGRALVVRSDWSMCNDGHFDAGHAPLDDVAWARLTMRALP